MFKYKRSKSLGASIVVLSVLLTSCGGGSGGGVAVVDADTSVGTNPDINTDTGTDVNTDTNIDTPAPAITGPVNIDVSDASIVTQATKAGATATARTRRGFSFPSIDAEGGEMMMTIPNGPLPTFPARRTVANGTGQTIEFGDAVTLKYDMFAWSNGELVESSNSFEEAHTVRAGVSDDFPIPEYLAKSLLGRRIGDTVQVVLPVGTADLPSYLDQEDAHILLVELL